MRIADSLPPELIRIAVAAMVIIGFVFLNVMILGYLERKLAGWFQRRPGPMEVGPHGILQMIIDGVKLIGKQFIIPKEAGGHYSAWRLSSPLSRSGYRSSWSLSAGNCRSATWTWGLSSSLQLWPSTLWRT